MALQIALSVFVVVGAWWFWLHCARPALLMLRAPRFVYYLVLGTTILTIVGYGADLLAIFAVGLPEWASVRWWVWVVVGWLWIMVVGFGWPQYSVLRRLFEHR